MIRAVLATAVAATALATLPAAAPGKGFDYGVAAGEVTSSSALLWTRANKTGAVVAELSSDKTFGDSDDVRRSATARASHDNTVSVKFAHLRAGRTYYYRFRQGTSRRSDTGRFATAPPKDSTKTIEFAISGDADAQPAPGQSTPFYNTFEVYRRMAREGNVFNVNLGDTIYSDSEIGGIPPALTVEEKWAKYRQNLALKNLQLLRRSAPVFNHWDDHEFQNDFSRAESGSAIFDAGVRAFRDYAPVTYSSTRGLYRHVRYGKNLEVFYLDERAFRDAKASQGGTCNNPSTGSPDVAPTLPPARRAALALVVPSFSQPVSQACLDRINDPNRTLLGRSQLQRFERDVNASKATFKIVVNETPIQQIYPYPYDRWEGYAAERESLLRYLDDNVANVLFLATDLHANLENVVRLRTLEDGGPVDTKSREMVTGPVAAKTFEKEFDEATGQPSAGDGIVNAFFKPAPPNGLGMRCASADVYSYTQVRVTRTKIVLTAKDLNGNTVREQASGAACGPFTVPRQ